MAKIAKCHKTTLCATAAIPSPSTTSSLSTATPPLSPPPMALQFRGKYQLSYGSTAHEGSITCVAFSIKGDYVTIGGLGQRLCIFSLDDGKLHYSIVTPSSIKSLIWLSGAEQMLVCACRSGILMNV